MVNYAYKYLFFTLNVNKGCNMNSEHSVFEQTNCFKNKFF